MSLAVKRRHRVRQQILVMQFVGHPRERLAQVVRAPQLEVAAPALGGDVPQFGIRPGIGSSSSAGKRSQESGKGESRV